MIRNKTGAVSRGIIYVFLFLLAVVWIYPLYFVVINSFSAAEEVTKGVYFFPRGVTLENFAYVFQTPLILTGIWVSVARAVAGTLTVFFKIILPVCKPVLACVAVFGAVWQWNAWSDNMFLVTDANLQTLQYLLYRMMQSSSMSEAITGKVRIEPIAVRLTMTCITVMPILLVYLFMQRFFVKGIMLGSVKG